MRLPFVLARRFVAGETLREALPAIRALHDQGLRTTLDLLGEYVADRDKAAAARDMYVRIVELVSTEHDLSGIDRNISIKLSMLGLKIDEAFCLDNLKILLENARERDVFVRIDMEGSDVTASTLSLFEQVYPLFHDNVGIVLQAYLKRTEDDVRRMCELNARVRLCKGAYKEPPEIAHQKMSVIRERFIAYMKMLIDSARYPAIATHDDKLIAATKHYAASVQRDPSTFEFQMLYGLRPKTQQQMVAEGYPMRIYVPFGSEWLPYFSRRLRERKENIWFVVSTLLRG